MAQWRRLVASLADMLCMHASMGLGSGFRASMHDDVDSMHDQMKPAGRCPHQRDRGCRRNSRSKGGLCAAALLHTAGGPPCSYLLLLCSILREDNSQSG